MITHHWAIEAGWSYTTLPTYWGENGWTTEWRLAKKFATNVEATELLVWFPDAAKHRITENICGVDDD